MSVGAFILGAIIFYAVMYFVTSFGLFDKMVKKYSLERARKLCIIIPIVFAILGGITIGYAGGTRLVEGEYQRERCGVCRDSVAHGYKVSKFFTTNYYCEEHKDFAYEQAGLIPSKSNRLEDIFGHDEFDAAAVARSIVKNNLKSPSTAQFCEHSEYTITCSGDGTWTVSGYVDAQNSFGATLRNDFSVKFTFESDEKYIVNYCNID